jgi:hypothetical protein
LCWVEDLSNRRSSKHVGRSYFEGTHVKALSFSLNTPQDAGEAGALMAQRAKEAAHRRGSSNHGSGAHGGGAHGGGGSGGGGSGGAKGGMGMGGLLFEDGVPPTIARMGRRNHGKGHGFRVKRHATVKSIAYLGLTPQARRSLMTHVLSSVDRLPGKRGFRDMVIVCDCV